MQTALRPLLRATAIAGLILVSACLEGASEAECGPDALGVSRTLTLTTESRPPYELLKRDEVILTFDDGPAWSRTKRVMKELSKECTRATFFLQGNQAETWPAIAKSIREAGHTVGSHSWDHANLAELPLPEAIENAKHGQSAVSAAIGQETPLFRFPFIATTPELSEAIHSAGLIDVTVTADGADWTDISPEDAVAQILAMLKQHDRRGMVLLHDPFSKSARRTRLLLQSLKAEGYSVVALEQPEG
ncbi:polysaccharide deacetylase family protein [Hyphomonas adhaerens]|uniref:polysaccharide deacetylase family protein n=1 Tax=Hyphomonas adhaerens TaxID=81029 RepID=UPI0023556F4C|nr:polysaccharide deacetylase family protein [Hyphomonas adhaerens]